MCDKKSEYQTINPTTQVSLYSICIGNCTNIENIQWNIYQYFENNSTWLLFNEINFYDNLWFFGLKTNNLASTTDLFINNPQINLWKFEVTYKFVLSKTSSSSINFILNSPPTNGTCSINPLNGTITTLFTISCQNWFDLNGIKDYSLYCKFFSI